MAKAVAWKARSPRPCAASVPLMWPTSVQPASASPPDSAAKKCGDRQFELIGVRRRVEHDVGARREHGRRGAVGDVPKVVGVGVVPVHQTTAPSEALHAGSGLG